MDVGSVKTRDLHQNTIIALWRDNRLAYPKAVDTFADGLDRLIYHRFCNWPLSTIGACWRLQPNQKRSAALKVETKMDLPATNHCSIRSLLVERRIGRPEAKRCHHDCEHRPQNAA